MTRPHHVGPFAEGRTTRVRGRTFVHVERQLRSDVAGRGSADTCSKTPVPKTGIGSEGTGGRKGARARSAYARAYDAYAVS